MKGMDIFCASHASTAICLSTDQPSSSSSSFSNSIQFGGRAIDRHNPLITDPRRTPSRDITTPSTDNTVPTSSSSSSSSSFSSHSHIDPKPLQKAKKNTAPKPSDKKKKSATKGHDQNKKSIAEKVTEHVANSYSCKSIDSVLKRSLVKPPPGLITTTTTTSSRYLLGESTASLDGVSDYDPVSAITKVDNYDKKKAQVIHEDENKHSSKSFITKSGSSDPVVVLRVSLHCKGCEGKVRKHLSRMKGVTSFNIDFAAKKVTVVGDVTPLSVLASISKVKTAKVWAPSAETKKTNLI